MIMAFKIKHNENIPTNLQTTPCVNRLYGCQKMALINLKITLVITTAAI